MGNYKLDDRPGLFSFSTKNPSKVLTAGNEVFLNHFRSFDKIRMQITNVSEKDFTVKVSENVSIDVQKGDHVVFISDPQGHNYVITASVTSVESNEPLEFKATVDIIEKMKDLKKAKRFTVSLPGEIKIAGISESVPIVVKKVSLEAVKISCSEDIMIEDIISTVMNIDEKKSIRFRGRVVKKTKADGKFDYGLEVYDSTDENKQALFRYISGLEIS